MHGLWWIEEKIKKDRSLSPQEILLLTEGSPETLPDVLGALLDKYDGALLDKYDEARARQLSQNNPTSAGVKIEP